MVRLPLLSQEPEGSEKKERGERDGRWSLLFKGGEGRKEENSTSEIGFPKTI